MKQYYLAHNLKDRKEIRLIQKELEFYYGLTLINPFYDLERTDVRFLDRGESMDFTLEHCRDIVSGDILAIRSCDGLIAFILKTDGMIGTFMELFYASFILQLPVYVISPHREVLGHPWIRALSFKLFQSVEDFKAYLDRNHTEMIL